MKCENSGCPQHFPDRRKKHALCRILYYSLIVLSFLAALPAHARQITDMAGRQVTVPDKIQKIYGTSPPATFMVYTLDPTMLAGLNAPLRPEDKKYLDKRIHRLPVLGGWMGQGRASNLETLLQVAPDIILSWWQEKSPVNEKIEKAITPLGIPLVYLKLTSMSDYPAAYRFLGGLLGQPERAEALAGYAGQTLEEAEKLRESVAEADRISVYYAEETDGLTTECDRSVHSQVITASGGRNVYQCTDTGHSGRQKISLEQVMRYDPQVIVSWEPQFIKNLADRPGWKNIRAVKDGRVYRIPRTPLNWFDRPPTFMRLLGTRWLINRLYPGAASRDMVAETRDFYRLFLHIELDEATARQILAP